MRDAMTAPVAAEGLAAVVRAAGAAAVRRRGGAVRGQVARWFDRDDPGRERARPNGTDADLTGVEDDLARRRCGDDQTSRRTHSALTLDALEDPDDGVRRAPGDGPRRRAKDLRPTLAPGGAPAEHLTVPCLRGRAVLGPIVHHGGPITIGQMHGDLRPDRPSPPDPAEG
ncbi:hypothetical protein [Streptomyces sp. PA5.6]|uniref:hypothetical protein n=1 Tax=Streptomyces sp. PA5.6 TaxID=3035651 RepID=UPI003904B132